MGGWMGIAVVSKFTHQQTDNIVQIIRLHNWRTRTDWLTQSVSFPAGLPWRSLAQCLGHRQHAPQFGVSSTNCTKESRLAVYFTGWQHCFFIHAQMWTTESGHRAGWRVGSQDDKSAQWVSGVFHYVNFDPRGLVWPCCLHANTQTR